MSVLQTEHIKLLQWYKLEGRHTLPWRNTQNLYHIYISEIMLQQTQVQRVKDEYYTQFLHKFPTLQILADTSLDDVLSAWSGLGYYSRARNLHATAKLMPHDLPKTEAELLKLPGIGPYTASAICSFGLHQNIPVVDTNIARVLKRYFALLNVKEKILYTFAKKFVNIQESRAHNLALMDLGSLVCLATKPFCQICPLEDNCLGKNEPELYTKRKKIQYESLDLFYGIYIKEDKIALQHSSGSMYKNMLTLPEVDPNDENFLGSFKHSYTKYRLNVKLYRLNHLSHEIVWIHLDQIENAPISSLVKKALQKI